MGQIKDLEKTVGGESKKKASGHIDGVRKGKGTASIRKRAGCTCWVGEKEKRYFPSLRIDRREKNREKGLRADDKICRG